MRTRTTGTQRTTRSGRRTTWTEVWSICGRSRETGWWRPIPRTIWPSIGTIVWPMTGSLTIDPWSSEA
jgi:hypothetical protein